VSKDATVYRKSIYTTNIRRENLREMEFTQNLVAPHFQPGFSMEGKDDIYLERKTILCALEALLKRRELLHNARTLFLHLAEDPDEPFSLKHLSPSDKQLCLVASQLLSALLPRLQTLHLNLRPRDGALLRTITATSANSIENLTIVSYAPMEMESFITWLSAGNGSKLRVLKLLSFMTGDALQKLLQLRFPLLESLFIGMEWFSANADQRRDLHESLRRFVEEHPKLRRLQIHHADGIFPAELDDLWYGPNSVHRTRYLLEPSTEERRFVQTLWRGSMPLIGDAIMRRQFNYNEKASLLSGLLPIDLQERCSFFWRQQLLPVVQDDGMLFDLALKECKSALLAHKLAGAMHNAELIQLMLLLLQKRMWGDAGSPEAFEPEFLDFLTSPYGVAAVIDWARRPIASFQCCEVFFEWLLPHDVSPQGSELLLQSLAELDASDLVFLFMSLASTRHAVRPLLLSDRRMYLLIADRNDMVTQLKSYLAQKKANAAK
jgi:hypothetical protein